MPDPNDRPLTRTEGGVPSVTVIVPTFNRARYLVENVDSVLGQDFTDFTLLVSDNASTDDTATVMERYDDPRVQYLRRPENIGWLRNFNDALAMTRTPFVTILNDDDLMAPGALTRAVGVLDVHPRVGMVHAAHDSVDADGAVLDVGCSWTHGLTRDTIESGRTFIWKLMRYYERVCPPSAVFRTAALPSTPYDPRDEPHAVSVLYLRIALDWDIAYVATSGVRWRVHGDQESSALAYVASDGAPARYTDTILQMRDVRLRFIDDHATQLGRPAALRRRVAHYVDAEMVTQARAELANGRCGVARCFAKSVRASPMVLVRPETGRLVVQTIVGSRGVRRYRKLRQQRTPVSAGGDTEQASGVGPGSVEDDEARDGNHEPSAP